MKTSIVFVVIAITYFLLFANVVADENNSNGDDRQNDVYAYAFSESTPVFKNNIFVDVYPTDVYIGDPLYLVFYSINDSPNDVKAISFSNLPLSEFNLRNKKALLRKEEGYWTYYMLESEKTFSSKVSENSFTCFKEIPNESRHSDVAVAEFTRSTPIFYERYAPNAKRILNLTYLETPPLEDFDDKFWEDVRNAATTEGATVKMSLPFDKSVELRFRERPENEVALLRSWKEGLRFDDPPILSRPYEIFDRDKSYVNEKTDFPSSPTVRYKFAMRNYTSREREMFHIGDKTYCPGWFVRVGMRKIPNWDGVRDLETFRQLEETLSPSSLRDEIQFIRMKMEVYAASNQKSRDEATRSLVDWLFTLPPAQRVIMMRSNPICYEHMKCDAPPGYDELDKALRSFSDDEALKEGNNENE